MASDAPASRFPWAFTVLLVVALFLYAAMAQSAGSSRSSDAAGNGMAQAFGVIFAVLLWIVLAILLLIARRHGAIPGWAMACLVVLLPLSVFGVSLSIALWSERGGWLIYLVFATPMLLTLYATWARFPTLQELLPANIPNGVIVAVLAIAAIAPFV